MVNRLLDSVGAGRDLEADRLEVERAVGDALGGAIDLRENGRDVDAAVCGGIGRQAPACLLQLPLAARPLAATGLVPRDGHMDEALAEVSLAGLGRPPCRLQLLVCLEVLPRRTSSSPSESATSFMACYAHAVATILLAGVDLFFRGKLDGLLRVISWSPRTRSRRRSS